MKAKISATIATIIVMAWIVLIGIVVYLCPKESIYVLLGGFFVAIAYYVWHKAYSLYDKGGDNGGTN